MKIKKYILIGGVLYLVYKAGEIRGHINCLSNIAYKYGDAILDEEGKLVDKVSKKLTLELCKKEKTAKGA